MRILLNNVMKQAIQFDGKSGETEATTRLELPNGGEVMVEQILASEEINKSKRAVH